MQGPSAPHLTGADRDAIPSQSIDSVRCCGGNLMWSQQVARSEHSQAVQLKD